MDKKWEKLNQKIKSKQADYEEPVIPFKSCNLIKDYNDLYAKIYDKEKLFSSNKQYNFIMYQILKLFL